MNQLYRSEAGRMFLFMAIIFSFLIISGCKQKLKDSSPNPEYTIEKIIDLPLQIHESSGLIYYDSLFWTFNDGGNESKVYGINEFTGEIKKVLIIADTEQTDWEDIAQDSTHIYIGDVGNNYGSRENLKVIRFPKSLITDLTEQVVASEAIFFTYHDQVDFSSNYRYTSYDCEALICKGDSLMLFTKDWINYTSTVYQVSKLPGKHVAVKLGTIDTEGLVAAADYNEHTHQLVLAGYSDYIPMIIIAENFKWQNITSNVLTKVLFDDYSGVKLEGITIKDGQIIVSSEGSVYQQAIYQVFKNK